MASGVEVSDKVLTLYNDMKLKKTSKKAVLLCLSKDKKQIIEEEDKHILHADAECNTTDPFDSFVQLFPPNDCRYALYDASFETKESKKEDLVFIMWAPESAPIKNKMIYASSKEALRKKFTGVKHEWQVNGQEELNDRCALADKLRGQGCPVVSLEGKPF